MPLDRPPRRRRPAALLAATAATAAATALLALAPAAQAALPLDLPETAAQQFDGAVAEYPGSAAAIVGDCDVTGDGRDDLAIGAPKATVAGTADIGRVYIVAGSAARAAGGYDLPGGGRGAQPPAGAIVIDGDPEEVATGSALDCAGDVNGDEIDDLVLSAPHADPPGRAYVVFGSRTLAADAPLRLDALGTHGFAIDSWTDSALGADVASLGDLDGDGKAEIAVSDDWGDARGDDYPGTVYVIGGKSDSATVDLTQPTSALIRISGAANYDRLSIVDGPGDVNGDGTPDLLLGAPLHDGTHGTDSGAAYVVSGRARGTIDLATPAGGSSGILFAIWGDDATRRGGTSSHSGSTIAGAGDVNGDGKQDVAVSSFALDGFTGGLVSNTVSIVYGKSDAGSVDLDAPGDDAYVLRGIPASQTSANFGGSLAPLGDVNGDELDDLAVGASSAAGTAGDNSGAAYVLYGRAQPQTVEIAELTCREGARVLGAANGSAFGATVAAAGAGFSAAGVPHLVVGAFSLAAAYVRVVPLAPVPNSCGPDPEPPAVPLDVDWGMRENFRRYVANGFNPAAPAVPISASGGAVCDVNPDPARGGCDPRLRAISSDPLPRRALRWTPVGAGATDGSDTTVATIGTVVFRYPGHHFTLTLQDPWLAIADGNVTLRARVDLDVADGFAGASPTDVRVALGTFPLDGTPTVTSQYVQWRTLAGTLTPEAGTALGGFLGAGAELDPVTITIPRSLGPLGDEPTVPQPGPGPGPVPGPAPGPGPGTVPPPARVTPPVVLRNPVATITAGARSATVKRAGDVLLGRVRCRVADCRVSVPRTLRLTVSGGATSGGVKRRGAGGRSSTRALAARRGSRRPLSRGPLVRVAAPARLGSGRRGEVRLVLGRAAVRALAGRRASARVTIVVRGAGRRVAKTVTVRLTGPPVTSARMR